MHAITDDVFIHEHVPSPFPVAPQGQSRGGRVPPTPQQGIQSAPLKSPLRVPLAMLCNSDKCTW